MSLPFVLPPTTSNGSSPAWVGNGFKIGDEFTKVLQYSMNSLGWTDDLTYFHEESAGKDHFIDCASRQHAIQELSRHLKNKIKPTILEIGCSSGYMLREIHENFPDALTIGSDVVNDPLHKLAETLPQFPLLRFDLLNCPLPDNSIDAIVILNVLEHIEKDDVALKQIHRILKPGGIAIIEVPAGPHLFDIYDKILMHFRRYKLKNLAKLIQTTGLHICKQSHLGAFLYPGFSYVKKRNKRLITKEIEAQQRMVQQNIQSTGKNKLLYALMKVELFLGKIISYPFGIRCLITCIKK